MYEPVTAGVYWTPEGILCLILSIIYTCANFFTVAAVVRAWRHKIHGFNKLTVADFIILNIAVADGFNGLGFIIAYPGTGANMQNSSLACNFLAGIEMGVGSVSFMSLFVLAYSRYAILRERTSNMSFNQGLTWRQARLYMTGVWMFGIFIGGWPVVTGIAQPPTSGLYCFGAFLRTSPASIVYCVLVILSIFVPSVGIFYCYRLVVSTVKKNCVDDVTFKRVNVMCITLAVVYVSCMGPFGIMVAYGLITNTNFGRIPDTIAFMMAMLNFLANPIAYSVFQKRYRRAIFDFTGIRWVMGAVTTRLSSKVSSMESMGMSSTDELVKDGDKRASQLSRKHTISYRNNFPSPPFKLEAFNNSDLDAPSPKAAGALEACRERRGVDDRPPSSSLEEAATTAADDVGVTVAASKDTAADSNIELDSLDSNIELSSQISFGALSMQQRHSHSPSSKAQARAVVRIDTGASVRRQTSLSNDKVSPSNDRDQSVTHVKQVAVDTTITIERNASVSSPAPPEAHDT